MNTYSHEHGQSASADVDLRRHTVGDRKETLVALTICAVFCYSDIIEAFCRLTRSVIGDIWKLDTAFCYAVLALLIIQSLPIIIKRLRLIDIALPIALLLAVFAASLWSKMPDIQMSVISDIAFKCLPAYWVCVSHRDDERLYRYLEYVAVIMLVTQAVLIVFYQNDGSISTSEHSQTVGYNALLSCLIFMSGVKRRRHTLFSIIGAVSALVLTMMSGTRGPFLCILIYGVISIALSLKNLSVKKAVLYIICVAVGFVLYLNMTRILTMLSLLFSDAGYSERLFKMLLNKDVTSDVARKYIFDAAFKYIKSHILFGCGFANDRVIIKQTAVYVHGDAIGAYPHNFFLEILMQFGALLGIVISIWFLIAAFKTIFKNNDALNREIMLIVFCVGFCPLLISCSYLTWGLFYVTLGFWAARRRRNKMSCVKP